MSTPTLKSLYLFPPAGAGATFYRGWKEGLGPAVQTVAFELPGRGRRYNEPHARSLRPLAEKIANEIPLSAELSLFGLSLGALLAYEVTVALESMGREVRHLFVASFCAPPRYPGLSRAKLSTMSDDDLVKYLHDMGGTPRELLESPEWMEFLLPVLRADLRLIDEHVFTTSPRVHAPITAFSGEADRDYPGPTIDGWRDLTAGAFRFESFPGGHFFVEQAAPRVHAIVRETLGAG